MTWNDVDERGPRASWSPYNEEHGEGRWEDTRMGMGDQWRYADDRQRHDTQSRWPESSDFRADERDPRDMRDDRARFESDERFAADQRFATEHARHEPRTDWRSRPRDDWRPGELRDRRSQDRSRDELRDRDDRAYDDWRARDDRHAQSSWTDDHQRRWREGQGDQPGDREYGDQRGMRSDRGHDDQRGVRGDDRGRDDQHHARGERDPQGSRDDQRDWRPEQQRAMHDRDARRGLHVRDEWRPSAPDDWRRGREWSPDQQRHGNEHDQRGHARGDERGPRDERGGRQARTADGRWRDHASGVNERSWFGVDVEEGRDDHRDDRGDWPERADGREPSSFGREPDRSGPRGNDQRRGRH